MRSTQPLDYIVYAGTSSISSERPQRAVYEAKFKRLRTRCRRRFTRLTAPFRLPLNEQVARSITKPRVVAQLSMFFGLLARFSLLHQASMV